MQNERNKRRTVVQKQKNTAPLSVSTVTNEMIIFVSVIFLSVIAMQFHFHRLNVCAVSCLRYCTLNGILLLFSFSSKLTFQ